MDPTLLVSIIGVIVAIVGVYVSYKESNKTKPPPPKEDPIIEQISINVQPTEAPTKAPTESHLLSANWMPLIDLIEDKQTGIEASYTIRLDIPLLKQHFDDYEKDIRDLSNAEEETLHTLKRGFKKARQDAEAILENLFWITEQMIKTGYNEREISVVCDRIVSFAVNKILGKLCIANYPRIEYLKDFVAFTLGYDKKDLLYLEFAAHGGRVITAEVPIDFLMSIETLVSVGEKVGSEDKMTTLEKKVISACLRFCEFDYAFDYKHQKELWT